MIARQVVLLFSILLNAILLYSLVWGEQGVLAYKELRDGEELLQARISQLDEENLALSREIRLLQSDEKYIEKTIRNKLNYVRESEILYVFPDTNEAAAAGVNGHETKN